MENQPKLLSIIIVSFNTRDILLDCIRCLRKVSTRRDIEIFLVDNASTDGSAQAVARGFPWVKRITSSTNCGFAAGNNLAIRESSGRFLLLLNSDAFVRPGAVESTVQFMERNPKCGILGVKLLGPEGMRQRSARKFPNLWYKFLVLSGVEHKFPGSKILGGPDYSWWDHSQPKTVDWVTGAYFLIRREVVAEIGLLDERYFLYCEEMDYCLRAKQAGWQVVLYPGAEVIHLAGASSSAARPGTCDSGGQILFHRIQSEYRFLRKHHGRAAVLQAALLEVAWKALSWAKNRLLQNQPAKLRRAEAAATIALIPKILVRDGYGEGRKR